MRVSVVCHARLPEPVDRAADAPAGGNCDRRAVEASVVKHTLPQGVPGACDTTI